MINRIVQIIRGNVGLEEVEEDVNQSKNLKLKLNELKGDISRVHLEVNGMKDEEKVLTQSVERYRREVESFLSKGKDKKAQISLGRLNLKEKKLTEIKSVSFNTEQTLIELEKIQDQLEIKIKKHESDNMILNAKLNGEELKYESTKDFEKSDMSQKLLEMECLNELVCENNEESNEEISLEDFKKDIEDQKKINESKYFERLASLMKNGKNKSSGRLDKIKKEFEQIDESNVKSKNDIGKLFWQKSSSNSRVNEKDDLINKFFNQ